MHLHVLCFIAGLILVGGHVSRQMVALAETFIANGTLELLFAFSSIEIGRNLIFVMAPHVVNKIAGHS